jgi:hypothetical protein
MLNNFKMGAFRGTLTLASYCQRISPGSRVERDGPIPWPPRSPDIMPLDFFLWRHVKDIVYKTSVISLDELKLRIVAAIE